MRNRRVTHFPSSLELTLRHAGDSVDGEPIAALQGLSRFGGGGVKSMVAFRGNGSWDTGRDRTVRAGSGLNVAWRPGSGGSSRGPGKQLLAH